jgi:phosphoglucomutase
MIQRVAATLGHAVFEAPVGFKWFANGLRDGRLGFAGEESAGASFSRRDGRVWTTDKDGIVAALLAGEITAITGRDPGERYRELAQALGEPVCDRIEVKATPAEKQILHDLSREQVPSATLAGETIQTILTHAPGNGAPIGGVKVVTKSGWFAARPSGTEDIYKIYAESFRGQEHLRRVIEDAQTIVNDALMEKRRESSTAAEESASA